MRNGSRGKSKSLEILRVLIAGILETSRFQRNKVTM